MEFVYCEGLSNAQPETNIFKVKSTTKISKGSPVMLDKSNFAVTPSFSDYSIGVAAEDYPHNGESGIMPKRDTIKVITAPDAVYRAYGIKMTFDATSTQHEFHTSAYYENGYYEQCILVLVSKGEDSENTAEIGSVISIDSSYSDGEKYILNVSANAGVPHPDDVYAILPAIGNSKVEASATSNFSLNSSGGAFRCIGYDLSMNNANGAPSCFLKLARHTSTKTSSY